MATMSARPEAVEEDQLQALLPTAPTHRPELPFASAPPLSTGDPREEEEFLPVPPAATQPEAATAPAMTVPAMHQTLSLSPSIDPTTARYPQVPPPSPFTATTSGDLAVSTSMRSPSTAVTACVATPAPEVAVTVAAPSPTPGGFSVAAASSATAGGFGVPDGASGGGIRVVSTRPVAPRSKSGAAVTNLPVANEVVNCHRPSTSVAAAEATAAPAASAELRTSADRVPVADHVLVGARTDAPVVASAAMAAAIAEQEATVASALHDEQIRENLGLLEDPLTHERALVRQQLEREVTLRRSELSQKQQWQEEHARRAVDHHDNRLLNHAYRGAEELLQGTQWGSALFGERSQTLRNGPRRRLSDWHMHCTRENQFIVRYNNALGSAVPLSTETSEVRGMEYALTHVPPIWTPDAEATQCALCDATFAMLRRRHHCRNCGFQMCDACSSPRWPRWAVPLTYSDGTRSKLHKHIRVCLSCDRLSVAFHSALLSGDAVTARSLCESGNVNLRRPFPHDRNRVYPVHAAAQGGSCELLHWLVVEKHCPLKVFTMKHETPLAVAMTALNLPAMSWLVSVGCCDIKSEVSDARLLANALCAALIAYANAAELQADPTFALARDLHGVIGTATRPPLDDTLERRLTTGPLVDEGLSVGSGSSGGGGGGGSLR